MSKSPPGPDGLPLVGNTHQFARGPLSFFERCAEYGDVAAVRVGRLSMYQLTAPEDIEQVLVADHDRFVKPAAVQRRLDSVFGRGLLVSEGSFWERQREIVQPAFYPQRLAEYTGAMETRARRMTDRWSAGDAFDARHEMGSLTLGILVDTILDADLDYHERGIGDALDDLYAKFNPRNQPIYVPEWIPTPTNRRYRRAVDHLEAIIEDVVEAHRDDDGRDNVVSILLTAETDEGDLEWQTIRDELMNLLLAGHETSALALTFALYLLASHPGKKRKLLAEVDEVVGDGSPLDADPADLQYTGKVFKEALRLYPPVIAVMREPTEAVEVGGYEVPEGTLVRMPQHLVHRDERFYDDPDTFRPERWTDEFEAELPEFAYFPFGGGPRKCIGSTMAVREAKVVLPVIFQAWDLELADEEPLELEPAGFTAHPKDAVEMVVRER